MSTIKELAMRKAETQELLDALSIQNRPDELSKRIAQDARFQLALTAAMRATSNYEAALRSLTTEQLVELAK